MLTISGRRECGKTRAIIREAASRGAILIVRDERAREEAFRSSKEMGLPLTTGWTFHEVLVGKQRIRAGSAVMIDDADQLLELLCGEGTNVCMITFQTGT